METVVDFNSISNENEIMTKPKPPDILKIKSTADFEQWYWLKEELVAYCQAKGINTTGGKFEIADRIIHFLKTGETSPKKNQPSKKTTFTFDWHSESLTLETPITDTYKNTQNVRRFMVSQVGSKFHFSISLMEWMTANAGKTLKDAVVEYQRTSEQAKDKNFKTTIKPHNQYNKYLRDFFEDNPDKTMTEARRCWKLKRALPGHVKRTVYLREDLNLKE